MDQSQRYYELASQGREAFLEEAAPAVLLRRRSDQLKPPGAPEVDTAGGFGDVTTTVGFAAEIARELAAAPGDFEIYPLAKKPGAAFADKITVGRTANNDVVFNDVTVSRFHAFLRPGPTWVVCDAGSKNGTRIGREKLSPRKETPIESGVELRFGDVKTQFCGAKELFDMLIAETS